MVSFRVERTDPGGYGFAFLDLTTGAYRYLWILPPQRFPTGFSWAEDGCSFYTLSDRSGGYYVDQLDFYGNLVSRSEFDFPEEDIEKTKTDFVPSPSGEWAAYNVHSGEMGLFYSDIQDIRLVPAGSQIPISNKLSDGGWNAEPDWSSDGMTLAFSDLDDNGITQLIAHDIVRHLNTLLASFPSGVKQIQSVEWSPDDAYLAVVVSNEDGEYSVWSIPAAGGTAMQADLGGRVLDRLSGWTDSGDSFVVIVEPDDTSDNSGKGDVLWIDAATGAIIRSLMLTENHAQPWDIFPVGDDQLFMFIDDSVFHLDGPTGNLTELGESPVGESKSIYRFHQFPNIRLGPPGFEGEESCE